MSDAEFQKSVLAAAKSYIERGWAVFPLHTICAGQCSCGTPNCGDAGKHPRSQLGLNEASKDPAQIERWFGAGAPPANIGIRTGAISGITVLDIDIGDGKLGAESWAAAIAGHGEPDTLMAQTGSGGMHVLFQYNSALNTSSNTLGKGVDCRNDGGYIVAAPSRHRSGGVYEWVEGQTALATLPAHLSRRKETRGRKKGEGAYRGKYTLQQAASMLEAIPSDDRDLWRSVGIILGREFSRSEEAWELYVAWSEKAGGKKGRNHDAIMHEAFHELSQQGASSELSIGTIVKLAIDAGWAPKSGEVPLDKFVFYGPGNNFIYRPTVSLWIAAAVDAAVSPLNEDGKIIKASDWLKTNQLVTSMTCDPAIDTDYLKGYDCRNGEIVAMDGAALFNSYRKPTIALGDSRLATPFLEHVRKIFNKDGDAEQFLNYMAHRVQRPEEKPRFALLIAGGQGVGKDTAVEFCCPAIGVWNVANIDPSAFEAAFNEYAAATLVRVSEAANLHDMSKWAFNERTKVLIAGSPDYCQINPKYGQKYSVRMHCGVIITTNHLSNGIYIPPDDRRYDVIESATMAEMGLADEATRKRYFSDLWDWFLQGGSAHVAAYLAEKPLGGWSASGGQRKTAAHATVVAGGTVGDSWLEDVLDAMNYPTGVREDWIVQHVVAAGGKAEDARKRINNAIGRLGYVAFMNPATPSGRWKISGKLVAVYVKAGTPRAFDPVAALAKEPF